MPMNLPNKLTIVRIIMIPFFVFFLLTDFVAGSKWIATVLFCAASLTDFLDGHIARKYNRDLLDSFTLIYHACDQLRAENTSYEQRRKQVELIRETAMSALFRPETLYSEKLKHFYPTTFVLSARMCIQELSMEVLRE